VGQKDLFCLWRVCSGCVLKGFRRLTGRSFSMTFSLSFPSEPLPETSQACVTHHRDTHSSLSRWKLGNHSLPDTITTLSIDKPSPCCSRRDVPQPRLGGSFPRCSPATCRMPRHLVSHSGALAPITLPRSFAPSPNTSRLSPASSISLSGP